MTHKKCVKSHNAQKIFELNFNIYLIRILIYRSRNPKCQYLLGNKLL
jgi:hypothetical protein